MQLRFALTIVCVFAVLSLASASAQDNWIGPLFGNWSNAGNWSLGTVPGPANDVTINGPIGNGGDFVILDPGTANIKSLVLGGYKNEPSFLSDEGVAQNLTIAQSLTIQPSGILLLKGGSTVTAGGLTLIQFGSADISGGSTLNVTGDAHSGQLITGRTGGGHNTLNIGGTLYLNPSFGNLMLFGNGDVANVGTLINNSTLFVGNGATLNLATQLNVTDIPMYTYYELYGNFNVPNNPFATLTSVEGILVIGYGHTTDITPVGGVLTDAKDFFVTGNGTTVRVTGGVVNSGSLSAGGGATVRVTGDVVNSGSLGAGGIATTLDISGTLTNKGDFGVGGMGTVLSVGKLVNSGNVFIGDGGTLRVANGGFYQLAAGTLGESFGTDGFGIIVAANGPVMLDGITLDITPPAYAAEGSIYKLFLFQSGELSGTFASIQQQTFNDGADWFRVIYDNADGYVALEAVPISEPTSLLLLGTGLLGACGAFRRKINL